MPRVDDRRVLDSKIFLNHNGLRWSDAHKECGRFEGTLQPVQAVGRRGGFARIMAGLASEAAVLKTVMIDATLLGTPHGD